MSWLHWATFPSINGRYTTNMTSNSRRDFLRAAAQAAGAATALGAVPLGIRNALAIPANNATGTVNDVQHIVVFMQENRSFDNYFGSLRGVRGFGDTRPIPPTTAKSVFFQPASTVRAGSGSQLARHACGLEQRPL